MSNARTRATVRKARPGGATPDLGLNKFVGLAAAVAYNIVVQEMRTQSRRSSDVGAILDEFSQLPGYQTLGSKQDRLRSFVGYIVVRALRGANGLRGLTSVAALARKDPDFVNIESFHYTYVQPYTKQFKPYLPRLTKFFRPRLFGAPGALAQDLRLRPKSAF